MEARGLVNTYICQDCKTKIYTINLTRGTTPFGIKCPNCSRDNCLSTFYRGGLGSNMPVTHAWYRPTKQQLRDEFTHPDWKEHFWLGGLTLKRLEEIKEMVSDEPPTDFNDFLVWIGKLYDIPYEEFTKMLRYRGITSVDHFNDRSKLASD